MARTMERLNSKTLIAGDGTELYYKDWGAGQPVILIHGWPLSCDSWDDIAVPIVDAGFRTIAYDRRGFGRSGQPWNGYDYDTLADDLGSVMEQTGVQDAILVGFSMGGGEVARFMSRHGGRGVAKAVLVSSIVPYMLQTEDNPEGTDPAIFAKVEAGIKEDRAKFFAGFFKDFFGVGMMSRPVSQELLDSCRNTAMQASLKATLQCASAFSTTDFRPELGSFRVPTLIIHGDSDKTVPIAPSARAAFRGIAGSTLLEYEGGPHGLFATHKEQLIRDLLGFLRQ